MSAPKSFKDMLCVTPGELAVPKVHKTLSVQVDPELSKIIENKKKEFTKFVNSERCNVCGSQLDGEVNHKEARLFCVKNNSHFTCRYVYSSKHIQDSCAIYTFADDNVQYQATSYNIGSELEPNYKNSISKVTLDLLPRLRFNQQINLLSFNGKPLIFPKNLTHKDFIKNINAYAVFM